MSLIVSKGSGGGQGDERGVSLETPVSGEIPGVSPQEEKQQGPGVIKLPCSNCLLEEAQKLLGVSQKGKGRG